MSEGFKKPIYWNKYKVILNTTYDANNYIGELLDASYEGVKRLFVLAYDNTVTADSHRRYFIPRIKMKIPTLKLMEEIFMINQLMT